MSYRPFVVLFAIPQIRATMPDAPPFGTQIRWRIILPLTLNFQVLSLVSKYLPGVCSLHEDDDWQTLVDTFWTFVLSAFVYVQPCRVSPYWLTGLTSRLLSSSSLSFDTDTCCQVHFRKSQTTRRNCLRQSRITSNVTVMYMAAHSQHSGRSLNWSLIGRKVGRKVKIGLLSDL